MDKLVVTIVLLTVTAVSCLDIKQHIDQRPDLTSLKAFFKNFNPNLYTQNFPSPQRYTFFAPNNEAFAKLPKGLRDKLDRGSISDSDMFEELMEYHTVANIFLGEITLSDFTTTAKKVTTSMSANIFYLRTNQKNYVNDALVVEGDIQADNGIIHIIDTVFYPVGDIVPLYYFIDRSATRTGPRYTQFLKLLQAYHSSVREVGSIAVSCLRTIDSTVFAPTDDAFSNIPVTVLSQLRNSPAELKKVVESHVICQEVIYSRVINDSLPQTYSSLEGSIKPTRFGDNLYVSNNCVQGQIVEGSQTLTNGVLHPIDSVLGFKYNSLLAEIESRHDVRRFAEHVKSSGVVRQELEWEGLPGTVVPDSELYTIFAPNQEAMDDVDFTQGDIDNILHMHMMRGQFKLQEIQNNLAKSTMGKNPETNAVAQFEFKTITDPITSQIDLFVQVNHVQARIIQGDICVKNGILHIVDNVLGIPSEGTLDFFIRNKELNDFYRLIASVGLQGDMTRKKLTIFAPTNIAFERMRNSQIGPTLLSSDYTQALKKVFLRHIVSEGGAIILTDRNLPMNLKSDFDDISVKKVGNQLYVTFNNNDDVKIIDANIRTENAVIHIIDEVMFVDDLQAAELVGEAVTMTTPLLTLLITSLFSCLLLI